MYAVAAVVAAVAAVVDAVSAVVLAVAASVAAVPAAVVLVSCAALSPSARVLITSYLDSSPSCIVFATTAASHVAYKLATSVFLLVKANKSATVLALIVVLTPSLLV